MAVSSELVEFVRSALARGLTRDEIGSTLTKAGWGREQVTQALAAWADIGCPVPVPAPRASVTARDSFTYLLLFTTLYVAVFSLGAILFHLVDAWLPDPVHDARETLREAIRSPVSSFIVAAPAFLLMARRVAAAVRLDPTERLSPTRRWLTYLTLFVASCVLIGDVTSLVYQLLGGALATRFLVKAGIAGALAGCVLAYFAEDWHADLAGSDGR